MFKAFKYRIYPSNPQKELMAKHIGSSRFVYNLALETKNAAYIGNNHNYSTFDLIKQLSKFKEGIKISLHRPTKVTIKSAIISVTPTGKKENTTMGVALGIKDFAITSEGAVFENPKYLRKAQSKLKYVQRKYSKYKGKRSKQKLAKLQEDVVHKRKDFLHKVATQLVRENQTIALETLAVKNRVKNHHLAQAISDVSWSTFNCSTVLDRDVNAAVNIKYFALKNHLSGEHTLKNQDELPTLVGVLTPEAHTSF